MTMTSILPPNAFVPPQDVDGLKILLTRQEKTNHDMREVFRGEIKGQKPQILAHSVLRSWVLAVDFRIFALRLCRQRAGNSSPYLRLRCAVCGYQELERLGQENVVLFETLVQERTIRLRACRALNGTDVTCRAARRKSDSRKRNPSKRTR